MAARSRTACAFRSRSRARCAPWCRQGLPLGARITGSDWREGGLTADDAVAIAKALKGEGIDFICISSGGVTADTRNPAEPGYNVPIAARVRKEAGIATRSVGLIVKPEQAEEIVAKGEADMVSMARCVPRRSALGLARRQGARRRGGAAGAICPRRAQAVGAGGGEGSRAVGQTSSSSPSCSPRSAMPAGTR